MNVETSITFADCKTAVDFLDERPRSYMYSWLFVSSESALEPFSKRQIVKLHRSCVSLKMYLCCIQDTEIMDVFLDVHVSISARVIQNMKKKYKTKHNC